MHRFLGRSALVAAAATAGTMLSGGIAEAGPTTCANGEGGYYIQVQSVTALAKYQGVLWHVTYDILAADTALPNATNGQFNAAETCAQSLTDPSGQHGNLVSIETATQNSYLAGLLTTNSITDAWIGLTSYYSTNGYWVDGNFSPLASGYSNYGPGIPYYVAGRQWFSMGNTAGGGRWGQDGTDSFPVGDVGAIVEFFDKVDEPSSLAVLVTSLFGLGFLYHRKKQRKPARAA